MAAALITLPRIVVGPPATVAPVADVTVLVSIEEVSARFSLYCADSAVMAPALGDCGAVAVTTPDEMPNTKVWTGCAWAVAAQPAKAVTRAVPCNNEFLYSISLIFLRLDT